MPVQTEIALAAGLSPWPSTAADIPVPVETTIGINHLLVNGMVLTPLDLSYEDILRYPAMTEMAVLFCPGVYENESSRDWYGVPVASILKEANLKPEAFQLIFHATDGYKITLPIYRITGMGAILAYQVDGLTLNHGDGFPFRLVSKDLEGDAWIRWINRIEVV
jgi:DMSO/TMAO reductase YedYZ molybdopterin-dependent catalytic subunit